MNEDTRTLYQYLGMDDLLPEGGVIAGRATGHDPLRRALDAAGQALERDPGPLLAALGRVWEGELSPELLAAYTEQARLALADPLVTRIQLQRIDRTRGGLTSSGKPLPDGFDFPYRSDLIPIDPERRKFEEYADWFRWFLHGVRWWAGDNVPFIPPVVKAPFRWHNHPAHASRFLYEEPATRPGRPLRIALFADFGTGEYQSRYIAEQLTRRHSDMAFHLGDVYYAGQRDELAQYFLVGARAKAGGQLFRGAAAAVAGSGHRHGLARAGAMAAACAAELAGVGAARGPRARAGQYPTLGPAALCGGPSRPESAPGAGSTPTRAGRPHRPVVLGASSLLRALRSH